MGLSAILVILKKCAVSLFVKGEFYAVKIVVKISRTNVKCLVNIVPGTLVLIVLFTSCFTGIIDYGICKLTNRHTDTTRKRIERRGNRSARSQRPQQSE